MTQKDTTFHFKQFDIAQDRCAMKVGTDGVLLGAWASLIGQKNDGEPVRILDIGTGTGLIAIMLAQRFSANGIPVMADAVEIDADAARQAAENAAATPWRAQICVHHCSLQEFAERQPEGTTYDLIVANPPFYNATLKPDDEARALARHKDALPVRDIMRCAANWLADAGTLAIIYPTDYDSEVMTEAVLAGLNPARIGRVLTKTGKPEKRRMLEVTRNGIGCKTEIIAIRDASGNYTAEYKNLTEPFYTSLN
jgi:tRNA1Val (adenine37-N6)-methyltransferase